MLNGMKKTIEIMKKANNNNDIDIQNLNKTLQDQNEIIDSKNNEINELENKIVEQGNEIEMLKQEVVSFKEILSSRENNLSENQTVMRNLTSDIEKKKIKIEGLVKILEDKENTISNLKNSVNLLNRNLEDTNETVEAYKKMNNDGMSNKSILLKSSERYEVENMEIRKRNEDLNSLKENLLYKISILESDLAELKQKESKLYEEKETLILNNKNLNERITLLVEENRNLYEEKNNKEKAVSIMESKFNEINNLYNQMYSNDLILKNEIETLNSKLNLKDKMIESIMKSKDEINEELIGLKEKFTQITLEKSFRNDGLDEKISEYKMNEIKFKRDIEKMNGELKSKEVYTETLKNLVADLKAKLNETCRKKDNDIMVLERSVEELKKEKSLLKDAESKLNIELEDSRNDLRYKTKLIDSLNNNVSELNESMISTKKEKEKIYFIVKEKNEIIEELKQQINELKMKNDEEERKYQENIKNKDEFKNYYQEIINKCNNYQKDYYEMKNSYEKVSFQYKALLEKYNFNIEKSARVDSPCFSNNNTFLNNEVNTNNFKLISEIDINNEKPRLEENKEENIFKPILYSNDQKDKSMLSIGELNSKLNNKSRNDRIMVSNGPSLLFTILDNKRLIKFDIEERNFKYVDFADFGDYEENFILGGSYVLNIEENLFIVTGQNHNLLYYYNHTKHSMTKMANLKNNHSSGSLVQHKNYLMCLSGINNKKVEKYYNTDILKCEYVDKKLNNCWTELNEMNCERSGSSYIIADDQYLYAVYGYHGPSKKCLDSVERLHLQKEGAWELINIRSEKNLPISFFNHSCYLLNQENIMLFGGVNGIYEKENRSFYIIDINSNTIKETEMKLDEEVKASLFSRNCNSVVYQEKVSKNYYNIIFNDENLIMNVQVGGNYISTYKNE